MRDLMIVAAMSLAAGIALGLYWRRPVLIADRSEHTLHMEVRQYVAASGQSSADSVTVHQVSTQTANGKPWVETTWHAVNPSSSWSIQASTAASLAETTVTQHTESRQAQWAVTVLWDDMEPAPAGVAVSRHVLGAAWATAGYNWQKQEVYLGITAVF